MAQQKQEYDKPVPLPYSVSEGFWQAARRHELRLQKCLECGRFRYPPSPACSGCLSARAEWAKVSGRGTVYTFTIFRRAFGPEWTSDIPYNTALVELEEGPKMISNVVGCSLEEIEIGMPVEVVFEDVTEEVSLPKFKPLGTEFQPA